MKNKRIRKIIGIAGAIIIVAFALVFIGHQMDLISINQEKGDAGSDFSLDEVVEKLGVEEEEVFEPSSIESVFYDELEIIGWEFIGVTEYDFNIEGVTAEVYRVYSVICKGNTPACYIVPEKDGEAMSYIYGYNADGSLTLLWSGE